MKQIERVVVQVRGRHVMLDSHQAPLYGSTLSEAAAPSAKRQHPQRSGSHLAAKASEL